MIKISPIFDFAVNSSIPFFEYGVEFIRTVSKIDSTISFMGEGENSLSTSFRYVIKQTKEILQPSSKAVSIMDCKDLNQQLYGLLEQCNSPKIHPFATQYEIYLGLQKKKEPKFETNNKMQI